MRINIGGKEMLIEKDTVVSLQYYKLSNSVGEIVEESTSPVSYLHGGYGGMFPIVEAALQGKEAGYRLSIAMEPEETFGEYDSELIRIEPRNAFPDTVEVGMQFEGGVEGEEENSEDMMIYTVTDVTEDIVVVDGNHPLAGMALQFECTVMEVRSATSDELSHGHVHGPHGHHDH
ncbi:FKBP-type peptidyl-prolyl cis-trans isomerase SlyD [Nitrosomonas sp. Nm132]|jgi:FKBP-type peptidyl-prolyl cis-trans isomerase SlyD|nr:FKBP-type peptidyl-prolyl cis-trans isomerase SlyD [Nitrosomonas sp. Nm132]